MKSVRGTALYANAFYDVNGAGQSIVSKVFNLGVGGFKPLSLLLEDGTEHPFEAAIPEMGNAQITQFTLSISYPDGSFVTPLALSFWPAVESF